MNAPRSGARLRRHAGEEDGAVLILFALLLVAMLTVAGLVIDFGTVRSGRHDNKSAADAAVTAGLRKLAPVNPGIPTPWLGICGAKRYLQANDDKFASVTESFARGNGTPLGFDPCDPTDPGYDIDTVNAWCAPASPSTWGVYQGTSSDGRVQVEIRSGYTLPDPGFSTIDTDLLDDDDTGHDACENLAVIVSEGTQRTFSGVVGEGDLNARVRSVGRVDTGGGTGDAVVALLLLERSDCGALTIEGNSGAVLKVGSAGTTPGLMHADSLGNGAGCNAGDPQNGNIFQVNGNPSAPVIIAGRSAVSGEPGVVSTVALSGAPGAVPAVATSPAPAEVCAQGAGTDCGPAPTTGGGAVGRDLIGRTRVDERYRSPHLIGLRDEANARIAWSAATAAANGFTVVACDAPGPFSVEKVYVDCAGGAWNGGGKTFTETVKDIVINGWIDVSGNGTTLRFVAPRTLYVRGQPDGNGPTGRIGFRLSGQNNTVSVNGGGLADLDGDGYVCDERDAQAASAREPTKMVIGDGRLTSSGGSNVLRLCQTFLFMADDTGGCGIPSTDGVAPFDNSCRGTIDLGGSSRLDWSAPNETNAPPSASDFAHFEDLAFWTESQGASNLNAIEGSGGVRLVGVVFIPNAKPFRVGGNGAYDLTEAQFFTRRLEVAGNGVLELRPKTNNAIPVATFESYLLVR